MACKDKPITAVTTADVATIPVKLTPARCINTPSATTYAAPTTTSLAQCWPIQIRDGPTSRISSPVVQSTAVLIRPGLWLQRITTLPPDDTMIEIAIASMREALKANGEEAPPGSLDPERRPILSTVEVRADQAPDQLTR